jgi:hypothetical protein
VLCWQRFNESHALVEARNLFTNQIQWGILERCPRSLFVPRVRLLKDFQALNNSCSAFATRQDRKRYLSTFWTIQVAAE